MSISQTVLLYGAAPAALCLLISLLAAGRGLFRRRRYRPGQPWRYPPAWWSANPEGAGLPEPEDTDPRRADDGRTDADPARGGSRGGAHGSW